MWVLATHTGWPAMNDPLTWSPISLGRWFGTNVRVHILLIFFVTTRNIEHPKDHATTVGTKKVIQISADFLPLHHAGNVSSG